MTYTINDLSKEAQARVREVAQTFQDLEKEVERFSPPLKPVIREFGLAIIKMCARLEYVEQRQDELEANPVINPDSAVKGVKNPYLEGVMGDVEDAEVVDDTEQPPTPSEAEGEPQDDASDDPATD